MSLKFKRAPRLLDVNRTPSRPKKKGITLMFDEASRKEFITGFRKRNLQRREKAKEKLTIDIKEEKKRLKQQIKNKFKTLVSHRDIPELEEILSKQEYEADGKTVSILEFNLADLAQNSNYIGSNKPSYDNEISDVEDDVDDDDDQDRVPGMEFDTEKSERKTSENKDNVKFTKKEISKEASRQAAKSKVFQKKQQVERQKNKKISNRNKLMKQRLLKKNKRKVNKTKSKS